MPRRSIRTPRRRSSRARSPSAQIGLGGVVEFVGVAVAASHHRFDNVADRRAASELRPGWPGTR